jgi:hypothetical protein
MSIKMMIMSEKDHVATALENALKGTTAELIDGSSDKIGEIDVLEDIPFGNKIALRDISIGEKVFKYGVVIGECTKDIAKGCLVHIHNVKSLRVDIPLAYKKEIMKQMGIEGEV